MKIIERKLIIIDTDSGVDDALAVMLATYCQQQGMVDILAITCTHGMTSVDNVCRNVCLALRASDSEQIKVYRGCEGPIIGNRISGDYVDGKDGLGDTTKDMPAIKVRVEAEHAAQALVRLAREHPKKITLITLGPLTNIAAAYLLDSNLFDNLAEIVFMGGTLDYNGNYGAVQEFNTLGDPEACSVLLSRATCPLISITWECGQTNPMTWDIYNKITNFDSKKALFAKQVLAKRLAFAKSDSTQKGIILCDILAIIAAIYPDYIETKCEFKTTVELKGELTRGELILDKGFDFKTDWKNVSFIRHFNQTLYSQLLIDYFK